MYIRGTESAQSDLLKYTSLNNLKTQPPPLLASQAINPLLPENQFYRVRSDRNSQLLRVKLLRLLIKTIVPLPDYKVNLPSANIVAAWLHILITGQ